MSQSIFSYFLWTALLVALQVLVGNHIHILGYATPMIYIYALMMLPTDTPQWLLLVGAFILGLVVDLFSSTPGLSASALLIVALLKPYILQVFAPSERNDEALAPSIKSMEWGGFTRYTIAMTFIYCLAFFSIEAFCFFNLKYLMLGVVSSTFLSTLLILGFERLRYNWFTPRLLFSSFLPIFINGSRPLFRQS